LGAVKRETENRRRPVVIFDDTIIPAYAAAFLVYRLAQAFGG
jgi:hypothetical protein